MAYSIDLSGRVVFITGASGGFGTQLALTLSRAGAAVVLASAQSRFVNGTVIAADDGFAV